MQASMNFSYFRVEPLGNMQEIIALYVRQSFESFYGELIEKPNSEYLLALIRKTNHTATAYEIYCHTKDLFQAFIEWSHLEGQGLLQPAGLRQLYMDFTKDYAISHLETIPSMFAYLMADMPESMKARVCQSHGV